MFLMHAAFLELVDGEFFFILVFCIQLSLFLLSGFWNGAIIFDKNTAVGAMFMISAILWVLGAPVAIFVFLKVVSLVLTLHRIII